MTAITINPGSYGAWDLQMSPTYQKQIGVDWNTPSSYTSPDTPAQMQGGPGKNWAWDGRGDYQAVAQNWRDLAWKAYNEYVDQGVIPPINPDQAAANFTYRAQTQWGAASNPADTGSQILALFQNQPALVQQRIQATGGNIADGNAIKAAQYQLTPDLQANVQQQKGWADAIAQSMVGHGGGFFGGGMGRALLLGGLAAFVGPEILSALGGTAGLGGAGLSAAELAAASGGGIAGLGGAGLTAAELAAASGGGLAAGSFGAADAAGLAQMAADAGLTGQAAADFVASGGTLGSTAAAAGAGTLPSGMDLGNPLDYTSPEGTLPDNVIPNETGDLVQNADGSISESGTQTGQTTGSTATNTEIGPYQKYIDQVTQYLQSKFELTPQNALSAAQKLLKAMNSGGSGSGGGTGAGGAAAGALGAAAGALGGGSGLTGGTGTAGGGSTMDDLLPWLQAGGTIADYFERPNVIGAAGKLLDNAVNNANKPYTPFDANQFMNNPNWQAYIKGLSDPGISRINEASAQAKNAQKARAAMSGQDMSAYGGLPGQPDVQDSLLERSRLDSIGSLTAGVTDKAFTNAQSQYEKGYTLPLTAEQAAASTLYAAKSLGAPSLGQTVINTTGAANTHPAGTTTTPTTGGGLPGTGGTGSGGSTGTLPGAGTGVGTGLPGTGGSTGTTTPDPTPDPAPVMTGDDDGNPLPAPIMTGDDDGNPLPDIFTDD